MPASWRLWEEAAEESYTIQTSVMHNTIMNNEHVKKSCNAVLSSCWVCVGMDVIVSCDGCHAEVMCHGGTRLQAPGQPQLQINTEAAPSWARLLGMGNLSTRTMVSGLYNSQIMYAL